MATPAQEQAMLKLQMIEPRPLTPLEMMSQVLQTQNPKDAVEVVKELAKLQMEMRKQDAEEEFNTALADCQREIKTVYKNAEGNGQKWATIDALDDEVRPIYSRYKFSVSWDSADSSVPDQMFVVAYLSKGLHTRRYQLPMDISGRGAKGGGVMDKPKAIGAGLTYGKRYLTAAIWNIPIKMEEPGEVNNGWVGERLEWIANCRNEAELTRIFNQAFSDAKKERAAQAMLLLVEARDKKKKELN